MVGVCVTYPQFRVEIKHKEQLVGVFGFDAATVDEVEDGITLRAAMLLKTSSVSPKLDQCTAQLFDQQGNYCTYHYDREQLMFKEI